MISCPKCGSVEHYHKVSALVEAETSHIDSSTQTVGVGVSVTNIGVGGATGNTTGIQRSALAQRLLPPKKPKGDGAGCGVIVAGTCVSIIFGIVVRIGTDLSTDSERYGVATSLVCLVATGVVAFLVTQDERKKLIPLNQEYEDKLRVWNRSWICKRCGTLSEQEE